MFYLFIGIICCCCWINSSSLSTSRHLSGCSCSVPALRACCRSVLVFRLHFSQPLLLTLPHKRKTTNSTTDKLNNRPPRTLPQNLWCHMVVCVCVCVGRVRTKASSGALTAHSCFCWPSACEGHSVSRVDTGPEHRGVKTKLCVTN